MTILRHLIDIAPESLLVRFRLAQLAIHFGDFPTARFALSFPDAPSAKLNTLYYRRFAVLHSRLDDVEIARRYLNTAIQMAPTRLAARRSKSVVFKNDTDELVNSYRQLAEMEGSTEDKCYALACAADALADAGRQEAGEIYSEIIAMDKNFTPAYSGWVECNRISDLSNPIVSQMRERLASPEIKRSSQLKHLHFALGHVYDRAGDAPRAIAHFLLGNAIRVAEGDTIDPDEMKQEKKEVREVFTAALIESLSEFGSQDDILVCICGMPRSGTSLIHQILADCPGVVGLGERADFFRVVRHLSFRYRKSGYPECCRELTPDMITDYVSEITSAYKMVAGEGRRVITKTPDDYANLGLIKILFPKTRIIHCKRMSLDNCLSCFSQNFGGIPYSSDVHNLSEVYREYLLTMRHWHSVFPSESLFDLQYEDIVDDPENVVREVCRFLNIEFDMKCLEFHKNHKPMATASRWQVRRPIYRTSVQRALQYQEFLGPIATIESFESSLRSGADVTAEKTAPPSSEVST